jgi:DNA-binding CsgD family transcriptional regulator
MMLLSERKTARLGNVSALVRASKSMQLPAVGEGVVRRRQMVAMFCRMLGEQLLDGKSSVRCSEPLSRRQRQTLELLLTGDAEKQIAARLSISRHTVHVYVKSLYKLFGVSSRGELLAKWVQR